MLELIQVGSLVYKYISMYTTWLTRDTKVLSEDVRLSEWLRLFGASVIIVFCSFLILSRLAKSIDVTDVSPRVPVSSVLGRVL